MWPWLNNKLHSRNWNKDQNFYEQSSISKYNVWLVSKNQRYVLQNAFFPYFSRSNLSDKLCGTKYTLIWIEEVCHKMIIITWSPNNNRLHWNNFSNISLPSIYSKSSLNSCHIQKESFYLHVFEVLTTIDLSSFFTICQL